MSSTKWDGKVEKEQVVSSKLRRVNSNHFTGRYFQSHDIGIMISSKKKRHL